MELTRRRVLAASAVTFGLAGCTSDDGDTTDDGSDSEDGTDGTDGEDGEDGTDGTGGSDGEDGTDGTDEPEPAVTVSSHPEHGDILVGSEGMTLYMFDADTRGEPESACHDDCANAWPPLTVEDEAVAGEDVEAELTTFERADGSTQVAADGWPLYFFAQDEELGDATGQGINDVWWVLRPDGTPVRPEEPADATVQVSSHPDHGDILVDSEGMTLYMFDADTRGEAASACHDDCADAWPPLTVDDEPVAGDGVDADLTTFEREDGSTQVAADGWPLYYFASDEQAGDANGQGINDVWWVLRPDGTPVRPGGGEEATVQVRSHAEHGDILVDSEGMTLYMFDSDTRGAGESSCYDGCAENWPPLTVDGDPSGGAAVEADLTTFEREGGSMQVAANGWPLYYYVSDEEPGDATGQGASEVWWVLDPAGSPVKPDEGSDGPNY